MLAAANASAALYAVYLIIGIVVVLGGGYGVLKLGKGQSVRTIAETAAADVARMAGLNDALKTENDAKEKRITALESQVATLTGLVTQAANVAALRKENGEQHAELVRGQKRIEELLRGK